MAVKYKQYLQQMYQENQQLFDNFETLHHQYAQNKSKYQAQYNQQGQQVMRVVEEWESRLCSRMERGKHSSYSHNLADKFRQALRERFPLIDFIGVEVETPPHTPISSKPALIKQPPKPSYLKELDDLDFSIPRITFD